MNLNAPTQTSQPQSSRPGLAVCTLWEGDYHKGVGTLANSLVRAGFKGKVWAGYRGDLPDWAASVVKEGVVQSLKVSPDLQVNFVKLDTTDHFSLYKGPWCLQVLEELDPEAGGVFYFDPDIFVLENWEFFESWVDIGVALCEDSHYPLNPSHPRAVLWQNYAKKWGFTVRHPADANINGGMVGVKREHATFFNEWNDLLDNVRREFNAGKQMKIGTRAHVFHIPDQDCLTIASWISEHPISRMGLDGMAFAQGEWLTLHAVEAPKPWRRRVLRDLMVSGFGPNRSLRRYWEFADGPIPVEPEFRRKLHNKVLIPIAGLLGRFYRRA